MNQNGWTPSKITNAKSFLEIRPLAILGVTQHDEMKTGKW
jgi:hypothetical protein